MTDYQNAVTDQLTIFAFPSQLSFCIRSKANSLKYYAAASSDLAHEHKAVLSSSIFARTTVVHSNVSFVLCPKGLSSEEQEDYYGLSHRAEAALFSEPLTEEIDVVYAAHSTLAVDGLIVNPVHTSDVKVLHVYKKGLSQSNAIYFSVLDGELLIRVYSGSKVLLVNRFNASSTDEIFYFVLFAVEQLKVDVNALHVEFTGNQSRYEQLKGMFQNYLPMLLKMPALHLDDSQLPDVQKAAWDNDWWPPVAVQCV